MVAEAEDSLLLDTVQVYSPAVVTVRVCVYCAVSGSSNTGEGESVRVKHHTSGYCDVTYIVKNYIVLT